MRRDPEDIEVAALPQVYNDPLKRNQRLYHSFVRDVASRCMFSATLFPLEHVGMFLVRKNHRRVALDIGCETIKRPLSASSWCATELSSEGFGRIEIALLEGVDVDSEAVGDLLIEFSIAIASTGVRDCFHWFRMPLSPE